MLWLVRRTRGGPWDWSRDMREQDGWDEHARFMDELVAEGFIVLGGPVEGDREAIHVVDAPSEAAIHERLSHDNWTQNGMLTTSSVERWTILLDPGLETARAARRWADEWGRGWREHDLGRIAALYADGAVFRSAPFREPQGPRAFAEWAFADEDAVECRFGEPVVSGDRAIVEYWAVVTSGGKEQTLAGVALLRFAPDGRVVEEHDYWEMQEGRREPFEEWGR